MEVTEEDVSALRSWIAQHPYLPQYRDDYFLRCVLIGAKGSLQQAKIRFDNYHKALQDYPSVFQADDLLYTEPSINFNKNTAVYLFPKKTARGYQVLGAKFLATEVKNYNAALYVHRIAFAALVNIWDQNYENGDLVYLIDMGNLQLGHLKTMTPTIIAALIAMVTNATCYKVKEMHAVRMPSYAEPICNLLVKAMSEKLQKRVHFHSSNETLKPFFQPEDLPEDYGGTAPSVSVMYEQYLERVKFHHDKVQIESKNRAEEVKKRPKSDITLADTFRKLDFD